VVSLASSRKNDYGKGVEVGGRMKEGIARQAGYQHMPEMKFKYLGS
jgi:hypothetical protein